MSTSQSDRNVLFGVLALQLEFITQAGLIAALQAWTLQKSRPLGELLVELGHMSDEDRAALEPMVDRHVVKHGGSAEQSLAAISSVSGIAEELREINDDDLQHSLAHAVASESRQAGALSDVASQQDASASGCLPSDDPLNTTDKFARQLQPTLSYGHAQEQQVLSRFQILRPHAEGGLGKVWIAKDRELNREVAFKEIKSQRAQDENSRSRFVLEAEINGGLEHPGIVPVYGLGHFKDGRPFYAMRFIRGRSLKEAIDQFHQRSRHAPRDEPNASPARSADNGSNKQTSSAASARHAERDGYVDGERGIAFRNLIQRLIDVCNAIAYAHSRGVLHRDLKPGNIMLGKYGETLVVDWGLAKAKGQSFDPAATAAESSLDREPSLNPQSSDEVASTQMGSAIGSPAYMSPEQAAGRLDLLGPASDVYSLGATLYHLLTGQAPFVGGSIVEILRRVQAGDFPRPREVVRADEERVSRRGAKLAEDGQEKREGHENEEHFGVTDSSSPLRTPRLCVKPSIPLPLEAICLKAMSREPHARYATVSALAEDLERWLAGEAVLAWPEPVHVRAKRWVRRHQTLVTSLAAMLLVAIVSLSVLSFVVSGSNQRLNFANATITAKNEQLTTANTTIRDQNSAIKGKNEELQNTNEQLAAARTDAEQKRDEAIAQKTRADQQAAIATAVNDFLTNDLLDQANIANQSLEQGDRNPNITVRELLDRAAKSVEGKFQDQPLVEASIQITISSAYHSLGISDAAKQHLEAALKTRREKLGEDHPDTLRTMSHLAVSYESLGQFNEAEALHKHLLDIQRQKLGENHLDTLTSMSHLAEIYGKRLRIDEAEALHKQVLDTRRQMLGADHLHTVRSMTNLALMHTWRGRFDEAELLYKQTLKLHRQKLGEVHPKTLMTMNNLAVFYLRRGRFDESESLLQSAVAGAISKHGIGLPNTQAYIRQLLWQYQQLKKPAAAEKLLRELTEIHNKTSGTESTEYATALISLGVNLFAQRKDAEGTETLAAAGEILKRHAQAGPESAAYASLLVQWGMALLDTEQFPPAEEKLRECLTLRQKLAPDDWSTFNTQSLLGASLAGQKKFADAEPLLLSGYAGLKAAESSKKLPLAAKYRFSEALQRLIDLYTALEKPDQAAEWKKKLDEASAAIKDAEAKLFAKPATEPAKPDLRMFKLAAGDWDTLLKAGAKVLPQLLILRATEMLKRGELAHAVQAAGKLRELDSKDKNNLYNAACLYARCAEFVTKDKPAPTDAEQAERQKFLNLALDTLKQSLAAGWDDFAHMRKDDDLKPLRGLPEFEALFPKKDQVKK